jgi:GTP-binding protein EngB required for normal cell division
MTVSTDELAGEAARVADLAADYPDVIARATRVAERASMGRFHVAVVGEFKRGKSTLINALLGADVLPRGVLPLTAIPTEVSFGEYAEATVVGLDGSRAEVGPTALFGFVTEAANPGNKHKVARVELRWPSPLLASGLTLVDTPGLGSVHAHNTETAEAAHDDADGAIVVLSADVPLSAAERELLGGFTTRDAHTFVVLNKTDHLSGDELDEVRAFVTDTIGDPTRKVWAISARAALDARCDRREPGPAAGEFDELMAAIEHFVAEELVDARRDAARREIDRLGVELSDRVKVEAAAAELDAATLAERVKRFREAADAHWRDFESDTVLLRHETAKLGAEIGDRLTSFARTAARVRLPELAAAANVPVAKLDATLHDVIEAAVIADFGQFRHVEQDRVEAAWTELAAGFRARTEQRVLSVRAEAAELFSVELPTVSVPAVAEERERFFYLFVRAESMSEPFLAAGRRLLPPALLRRRVLGRAEQDLVQEFDKHAGRSRWDLTERLDGVRRRFEKAMRSELNASAEAILTAAGRVESARDRGEQIVADQRRRRAHILAELAALRSPVEPPTEPDGNGELERWLELCRTIADGPLDGIEEPAARLASYAGRDRRLMEQARRRLLDLQRAQPGDSTIKQMLSLWRRAFERGAWDWDT